MTWREAKPALLAALILSAAVGLALIVGWGFTVDDALISTRVAHQLSVGAGHRFNAHGPLVDCVTPLGWAQLLASLSGAGAWEGFLAARWLGAVASITWAAVCGVCLKHVKLRSLLCVALPVAVCLPVGAWSASGMETSIVVLLVALSLGRSRWALVPAGLAAAWRPEMIPWALGLGLLRQARDPRERLLHVLIPLAPPLAVAVLRNVVFGHAAPLAAFAKPADFTSGIYYAVAGTLWLGLPVLWLCRDPWRRVSAHTRVLALTALIHLAALVAAGGDWMALFRLFVPLAPLLVVVAAELAEQSALLPLLARGVTATAIAAWLLLDKGPAARGVTTQRATLIAHAAPHLADARRVATLDVGWVGATTAAPLVDFAGVTDPEVAFLPGGHTSKQLPRDFLLRRNPDALVLLLAPGIDDHAVDATDDWRRLPFARIVEHRVARLDGASTFVPIATLPLIGTNQRYLVLRRLSERLAALDW